MEEPSLRDVVTHLERIEATLGEIRRTLAARFTPPPPRVTPPPPPGSAGVDHAPSEAAVAVLAPETPPLPFPIPGPGADPRECLRAIFAAAVLEDQEDCFRVLAALTHTEDLEPPRALDHLRAFAWKRLRKAADRYLPSGDPARFQLVRTVPEAIEASTEYLKLFLGQAEGSPVPITLRRDRAVGGAWRIHQSSL
jgi:hypothetical protein